VMWKTRQEALKSAYPEVTFQTIAQAMEMEGVKTVIFDLTTVRTITSSGIGKIMNFFKFMDSKKGSMSVKGISEQLYKQFMEIHLDRIFPIAK